MHERKYGNPRRKHASRAGWKTEEKEHSQTPTAPTAAPSPPLPSFTPLMLHARRRSKRGGQTMEMWMRAHSVSCPPLFSDGVAQFMFALYRRCLPHVIPVSPNSLRSLRPGDTLHCGHMGQGRRAPAGPVF
ncbi:unnamed protein product [Pleuronectes platessa]|uniref:Uncharacterized protein n=1 Tax=Pleuronectes platessa TaxID=8262 RepID=A0A9N7TKZ8_PLEPL|nr:unnamed protein product [Pleuronectes platessa]